MKSSDAWSRGEVEVIVADYFEMLTLELSGQPYNKSEHRRVLQEELGDRSEGSIEKKHQNISAALLELGCPYISGYKPLPNYQQRLFDVVAERISSDRVFERSALVAVEQPVDVPMNADLATLLTNAPTMQTKAAEPSVMSPPRMFRDYLARETRNRSLGLAGEELVVSYERYRLFQADKKDLSERVEHISKTRGDGLGFDILSYDADGRERYIEVKTTTFGRETPFYISRSELEFSRSVSAQFHLYRVYEFRRGPRMFDLAGSVGGHCLLDPITYEARFS